MESELFSLDSQICDVLNRLYARDEKNLDDLNEIKQLVDRCQDMHDNKCKQIQALQNEIAARDIEQKEHAAMIGR